MKIKIEVKYFCPFCKSEFLTRKEAVNCRKRGLDKSLFKVGNIVKLYNCFGWFNGNKSWVMDLSLGNSEFSFYYVVTEIDSVGHRVRYHVATKAIQGGYSHGYTFNTGHRVLEMVKNPPKIVIDDSKDLLGLKWTYLI